MRNIALALAVTALAATAASASEWAFDDNYWKKPDVATSFQSQADVSPQISGETFDKYRHVDGYNP